MGKGGNDMKIELEQLKSLIDGGDKVAVETYIKQNIEKTDMDALVSINTDVRSYLDSAKDTHHTTALETWKGKNLQPLIDAAVKDATKDSELTDDQKRIAALEQQVADSQAKEARALLRAELTPVATEAKIPVEVLDLIVKVGGEDAKTTFEAIKTAQETTLKAVVDNAFAGGGRNPGGAGGQGGVEEGSFGASLAKSNATTQASIDAQANYFG